jgi:hypothetical protein
MGGSPPAVSLLFETTKETSMAVVTAFLLSSAALVCGAVALLVLHGGWQSADAGFLILAGSVFAGSVIALGAARDHRT